jgi:hypothetical protein
VKALQTIIGLFYTELLETSEFFMQMSTGKLAPSLPKISAQDLENGQRILDRLTIVVDRLHIRSEEFFASHLPTMKGKEVMTLGVLVDQLEFRGPDATELSSLPESWTTSHRDGIIVNKISHCKDLSVYCCREDPIHILSDDRFSIDVVKLCHFHRREGCMLSPMDLSASLSVVYQKSIHTFGPVKLGLKLGDLAMHLSDEQIAYFMRFIDNIVNYLQSLRARSRRHLYLCITNSSQRARLRWNMIRDTIKQDFYQYGASLESGSIRWRLWFEQWRLLARYVAIREIMIYHLGYEPEVNELSDIPASSFAECLIDDHAKVVRPSSERSRIDDEDINGDKEAARKNRMKPSYRYRGRGMIPSKHMKSAELLLRNLTRQVGPFNEENPRFLVNSLGLSASVIRALYTLQLEIETILPLRVCARARIWAEDKVRKLMQSPNPNVSKAMDESAAPAVTLLLAVVDGTGFRASFGMSTVDAYCTIQASGYPSIGTLYSESKSSPIGQGSDTALISWGQVFSIPITEQSLSFYQAPKADATESAENLPSLRVDVEGTGILSFSYGRGYLPVASAFDLPAIQDLKSLSTQESSIREHVLAIKSAATSLNFTQAEVSDLSLRVMSMVVVGNTSNATNKFQARIKDAIEERRSIISRQEQVARREKLAGASDQEEEVFILDPSVLSLQDLQLEVNLPMISLTIYAIHADGNRSDSKSIIYSQSPLCKLIVSNLAVHGKLSSNPWSGFIQAEIASLQLQESRNMTKSSDLVQPMLSLNDLVIAMNFSQISTMSQYVSGLLDPTCFEWSASISMFPITIKLTSQSTAMSNNKMSKLWTNHRLLPHLGEPIAGWSLAGGSGRNPPQSSSILHAEAQLRFGDSYVLYPSHLHVAQEVVAWIQHKDAMQKTVFSTSTGSRRFDAEIVVTGDGRTMRYDSSSLKESASAKTSSSSTAAPVINAEVFTDFFGNMAQATSGFMASNSTATATSASLPADNKPIGDIGGFLDWMGKSIATNVDTSSTQGAAGSGPTKTVSWEVERTQLQERIRELEAKNRQLEGKLR